MSNRNVGEGRSNDVTGAHIITCSAGLRRSPAELRGCTRFDVLEPLALRGMRTSACTKACTTSERGEHNIINVTPVSTYCHRISSRVP